MRKSVLLMLTLLAAACGRSPTAPAATGSATTTVASATDPATDGYSYLLPTGASRLHIVATAQPGACHTFRVSLDQKVIVDTTLGCNGGSQSYDKMHAAIGRAVDVRHTPLNNTLTWSIASE